MVTCEILSQTLIPNTVMRKMLVDGVHKGYSIQPISGYVLHDNTMDIDIIDEATYEVVGRKFGYSPSSVDVTCGLNYDFSTRTVTGENGNTYTAYGDREFFAVLESTAPADQIFGGGDDHEVMKAEIV